MDDPYLRTRKDDVDHVVHRILRILLNQPPQPFETYDGCLAGGIVNLACRIGFAAQQHRLAQKRTHGHHD